MTKQELINRVAMSTDLSQRAVSEALDGIVATITEQVKAGNDVQITGFGKFESVRQDAKTVVTFGVSKDVPAKTVVKFRPSSALKDAIA